MKLHKQAQSSMNRANVAQIQASWLSVIQDVWTKTTNGQCNCHWPTPRIYMWTNCFIDPVPAAQPRHHCGPDWQLFLRGSQIIAALCGLCIAILYSTKTASTAGIGFRHWQSGSSPPPPSSTSPSLPFPPPLPLQDWRKNLTTKFVVQISACTNRHHSQDCHVKPRRW